MNELYSHLDGLGEVRIDAKAGRLFLFNEAEGLSAWAYIGPVGLRHLAAELVSIADEMEAKHE